MSPARRLGASTKSAEALKVSPSMAASITIGAVRPSPRHMGRHPGLIDEDPLCWIQTRLQGGPGLALGGYVIAPLFAGVRCLF